MSVAVDRILVVGPSWVGDMVMAQSLFMTIREVHLGCELDVLAPAWSQPLLARMPQVSSAITSPFQHGEVAIGGRRRLGKRLRDPAYDQAIVLPNSFKSALLPWFANIPRRTGWRGEWRYGLLNDLRVLDPAKYPTMVQRFVALGLAADAHLPATLPNPQLALNAAAVARCRDAFSLEDGRPILALCPGAEFGPAKCWPAEHYATLAGRYLEQGWQLLLLGSGNDREATSAIREACPDTPLCRDLAGKTSLAEVVDLLSVADAVVSNDSGLMHIAAALRRPLVAVYGATSPEFTPPLGERVACQVSDIDCAPCFQRHCPLGHHRCMRETSPGQVADKLDALLMGSD